MTENLGLQKDSFVMVVAEEFVEEDKTPRNPAVAVVKICVLSETNVVTEEALPGFFEVTENCFKNGEELICKKPADPAVKLESSVVLALVNVAFASNCRISSKEFV